MYSNTSVCVNLNRLTVENILNSVVNIQSLSNEIRCHATLGRFVHSQQTALESLVLGMCGFDFCCEERVLFYVSFSKP
jgi:hypothetical protein